MTRHPIDRKLQLQIIFAFTFIFAILLFVPPRESTGAQIVFRVSMALVGLIGFFAVSRRRRS